MASEQTVASAPPPSPFDHPRADIILRSSDGTDFRMHKAMLAWASPVFDGMLSLPAPADGASADEQKDGLPVVQLTESAAVLGVLLRFCLPQAPPALRDLRLAVGVRAAAAKYEIGWATDVASKAVDTLAEKDPLLLYAMACREGNERDARRAAFCALRLSPSTISESQSPEIEGLTVGQHRRLLRYRQRCGEAVAEGLARLKNWPGRYTSILYAQRPSLCAAWVSQYLDKITEPLKQHTWSGCLKFEIPVIVFNSHMPCERCESNHVAHAPYLTSLVTTMIEEEVTELDLEWK